MAQPNNPPPPAAVPTLYFCKDPNPPTPPPVPVPPAAAPAPQPEKPKSSFHILPRGLFQRQDKPQAPPAPSATLHFRKDAPTAPGAAPVVAPPVLHFAKEPKPPTAQLRPNNEVPPRGVVRVAMQAAPGVPPLPAVPEEETYTIQLNPPGPQRVFRLQSERDFQNRMQQEARQRGQRVEFPPEPIVSTESFAGRNYPPLTEVVEPGYVCYRRLYFEERNAERYDWDLGFMQPLVSVGYFYKDFLLLPYHMFTDPCRCFDCDAGYCLPGDPMPYLLYPPALSLTGTIAEAGAVLAVLALLPG